MCRTSGIRTSEHQDRRDQLHHHEPGDLEARRSSGSVDLQLERRRRATRGTPAWGGRPRGSGGCVRAPAMVCSQLREVDWSTTVGRDGRPAPSSGRVASTAHFGDGSTSPAVAGPRAVPVAVREAIREPQHVHHPDREPEDRPDKRQPAGSSPTSDRGRSRAAAGSANSSPMVVTREAQSRPTASEDRGSGCSTTHDSRSPAAPRADAARAHPPAGLAGPAPDRLREDAEARGRSRADQLYLRRYPLSTPQPASSRNFSQSPPRSNSRSEVACDSR